MFGKCVLSAFISLFFVCACATETKPGLSGKGPTVTKSSPTDTDRLPNKEMLNNLIGKWSGILVGQNKDSISGRTIVLMINEVSEKTNKASGKKVRGIYVRRDSPDPSRAFAFGGSQEEFTADLVEGKNLMFKWKRESPSKEAEFEVIYRDGIMFFTGVSRFQYHKAVLEKEK